MLIFEFSNPRQTIAPAPTHAPAPEPTPEPTPPTRGNFIEEARKRNELLVEKARRQHRKINPFLLRQI